MGDTTSQAKNVWVVAFGVKITKRHNKNNTGYIDDYALALDKAGNSAFIRWQDLNLAEENIISDAYLYEVFSDLHDTASNAYGLYHLQPASTPEIADFLVQMHIIPLLRDLEIIEHGVSQALQRHDTAHNKASELTHLFFQQRFKAIRKIETRIRQEQQQTLRPKKKGQPNLQLAAVPS